MAEKNLESILIENRSFPPAQSFVDRAVVKPAQLTTLYAEAEADHVGFWAARALEELSWETPFTQVLDAGNAPNYAWFADGRLNVSYNCLDVHLPSLADKPAILFVGEQGERRELTYAELTAEVCAFANALLAQGISSGDRVVIYMPMVPEAVVAMQALRPHRCRAFGCVRRILCTGIA